ncbi:hypothetical protein TNCV_4215651 [Trichonephila clavipes]|nr:hypothetical protein TNCV_4215651 [Trichonephila clavipes]
MKGIDVCKCIVLSRHGGALNRYRAANPLVKLVKGEKEDIVPDHLQGPSLKIGVKKGPNPTVACMVLKHTASDMRHLGLYYDEFRSFQSGL